MNTYRDAKRMAKALETALRARDVPISHGESLDLVARQFGLNDWNVLSAQIKREEAAASRRTRACTGWDFIGEHPTEFDYGLDTDARQSGRRAALIRYARAQASTRYRDVAQVFGCLAQHVWAGHYHGRRIEIRAELATQDVSHGATIWARVDQTRGHVLAFDNLKGSRDGGWLFAENSWTERRIVIDVPPQGTVLGFGFFLKGTGSVWAADFSVRIVDPSTPLTGVPQEQPASDASGIVPRNLDFSDEGELTF